jgi:hypothetical protein
MDVLFRFLHERWPGLLLEAVLLSCLGAAMLWSGVVQRPVVKGTALTLALLSVQLLLWVRLDPVWASRWSLFAMALWFIAIGIVGGWRAEGGRGR